MLWSIADRRKDTEPQGLHSVGLVLHLLSLGKSNASAVIHSKYLH
jgi:hypothetical protein